MFKKVATLQFKKIYASDNNKDYYWRDFVKQANDKLATDSTFVPKNFYEYNTDKFLYLTARAISGMEKWGPNGNYDAFPWEELKRSYPTFCGKGFYIEHKEDDEKDAKGIILDAQPDDDNEFINCICAISKEEYPEICDDILNGKLNQVSMSCLASSCECSRCHNVATKEEELCEHMNPEHPHFCKGSLDENNKPIYEINRNIVFTGLSGVAVPADKDAFIFDVKASKKSKTSIDKEYNKYLRAKKEYEYINSLLEKENTRKYIESKLEKKASYTDKEISNIGYEQGIKDGTKAKGIKETKEIIDENLNQLKEKYDKDKNGMGSFILKEWNSFVSGYTNGFSDGLIGNIEKKANKYRIKDIKINTYPKIKPIEADNAEEAISIFIKRFPTYKKEDFIAEDYIEKKANVEYFSDKVQEIPEIDFYTEFMNAGKSKGCNSDINKDQLELGIKVEMEHTTNPVIAEKIACDHIKEIPNYYTLLAEMEASAKASFEEAKHVVNTETNEEYPETTIQANKKITIKANNQFFKIQHINNKQFFKVNKASKKWFKIANIYDDPEERNDIDNYGLTQLERETISDVIYNINRVNEDTVITWPELIESIPTEIISIDKMNKNKDKIIQFIQNELGQEIEVY